MCTWSKTGLHLVSIFIQPVCRQDNEKGRNGRGKRSSENSRNDTEQFEICRHNIDGRKKSGFDKTDKKAEERERKGGPIFQHKEDKDYDNSQLGQLEIDGEEIEVVTSFTFLGSEVEKRKGVTKK